MTEHNSDLLPLYDSSRGFDTAMRGYDRAQVDREVGRLDDDVRVTAAERDSAAARSADLAAQLASTQAQIESLRRQLRAASETVTADNVDERVTQILQTAAADGAKVRADAQARAEQVRNGAADAAARTRAAAQSEAERIVAEATEQMTEAEDTFKRRIAEAEQHKRAVEASLAENEARTRADEAALSAQAETTRTSLDAEAADERARLEHESAADRERVDAESLVARTQAQHDFEITLRLRRTAAHKEQVEKQQQAEDTARRTVEDSRGTAAQFVADATHEVRRLHGVRDDTHAQLEALHGRLRSSLDESLATTPAEPNLPASSSDVGPRPMPSPGVTVSQAHPAE